MNRTALIEDLTLLPLPPWWQSPWAVAGILIAILALGALGWWLWRRAQGRRLPVPVRVPEPDRVPEFLERLEALRGRRGDLSAHDFAFECSEVLREFVEWRHRLAIRFQTTREFLDAAACHAALAAPQRERLGEYLRSCDLLKFARRDATLEEEERLVDAAVGLVRQGGAR